MLTHKTKIVNQNQRTTEQNNIFQTAQMQLEKKKPAV